MKSLAKIMFLAQIQVLLRVLIMLLLLISLRGVKLWLSMKYFYQNDNFLTIMFSKRFSRKVGICLILINRVRVFLLALTQQLNLFGNATLVGLGLNVCGHDLLKSVGR